MKIIIVSPSAGITHLSARTIQFTQGLKTLENLGIKYKLGKHTKESYSYISSSITHRLQDLHRAYNDKSINAILAANGGWNSNQLLESLDWGLIKNNPKPLIGFSDISVLLNAIYKKTGVPQIHGPMVTWGLHNNDTLTNTSFLNALDQQPQTYPLKEFGKFWKGNALVGTLVGGNLVSLSNLLGTPYEPNWKNKILFWEETEETIYRLDRVLTHFKNCGIWDQIKGMIIGHLDQIDEQFVNSKTDTTKLIKDHFKSYNFPILQIELFGHNTKSFISLPIGGTIQANRKEAIIS